MEMEKAFYDAGGFLVVGTDPTGAGDVVPGYANQRAVQLLIEMGLTVEQAVEVATRNGAIQLGIDDQTGSIEVGKDADIAIWDAHPLSMFSKAVQTYVNGALYFDIEMDVERQEAIEAEVAALVEKHGVGQSGGSEATDRVASPGQPNGGNR